VRRKYTLNRYIALTLVTLCPWLWNTAHAQDIRPPVLDEVVRKVQEVYSRQCCFTARFDQLTVNVSMDLQDRFQGVMYVRKPGLIALDVQLPEPQKVVIRGRSYVVVFLDDGNVVRGEVPPEINLEHFFGFFANMGNIEESFTVQFPVKPLDPEDGLIFLELTDKKDPRTTYRILLGIDSARFTVRRAIIYDALGNYNRFDLSDVAFLKSIPDSRFEAAAGPVGSVSPASAPLSDDRDK